eukprot:gene50463-61739_t
MWRMEHYGIKIRNLHSGAALAVDTLRFIPGAISSSGWHSSHRLPEVDTYRGVKKLPPLVHAGEGFGEVFEELSKEGSSQAYQQPAEAQSRYLLTKFELGWLSVHGEEIARLVAEEKWAKAAEAWVSVNDK